MAIANSQLRDSFACRQVDLEILKKIHGETSEAGAHGHRIVLVHGPAGVGKSLLMDTFRRYLQKRHEPVFLGACRAEYSGTFHPFVEIAQQIVHTLNDLGINSVQATALLDRLGNDLHQTDHQLAEAWAGNRWELFDSFAALFQTMGEAMPSTILLDNLHHADSSTLDLFRHLIENLNPEDALQMALPAGEQAQSLFNGLFICAMQDGPLCDLMQRDLESLENFTALSISGFNREDIARFLQSDGIINRFYESSGGNPHNLEELIISLPEQVGDLFLERVKRLDSDARKVLELLAVLVRPAPAKLLQRASRLANHRIERAVRELLEQNIIHRELAEGHYSININKPIHREQLYEAMSDEVRGEWHLRLATLLSQAEMASTNEIARHFIRSSRPESGAEQILLAAKKLEARFAFGEAVDLLTRLLENNRISTELRLDILTNLIALHQKIGAPSKALYFAGLKLRACNEAQGPAILRQCGKILKENGRTAAALRVLGRALSEAEKANHAAEATRIESHIAEVHFLRGEYPEAEGLSRKLLESEGVEGCVVVNSANTLGKILLAREEFDEALFLFQRNIELSGKNRLGEEMWKAANNSGIVRFRQGQYELAEKQYREALDLSLKQKDPNGEAFAELNLGTLFHEKGIFSRAIRHYHRSLSAFRRIGNQTQLCRTAANLGNLYLTFADHSGALKLVKLAHRVAEAISSKQLLVYTQTLLGEIALEQGRPDEAITELRESLHGFEELGNRRAQVEVSISLARAYLTISREDVATQVLTKAERFLEKHSIPCASGRFFLLRGEMALSQGEAGAHEEAENHLQRAFSLFSSENDQEGLWRAHHALGRLQARRDNLLEAENHLLKAQNLVDTLARRVPDDLRSGYLQQRQRKELAAQLAAFTTPAEGVGSGTGQEAPLAPLRRAGAITEKLSAGLESGVSKKSSARARKGPYAAIIGSSTKLTKVLNLVEKVARAETTVLISGESGTGKELIAEAIHHDGPRKNKPFIKVNCAALVETLLLSELFGHEKGAFTGALQRKLGRFEVADGGTIFLDEIGDISPKTQVSLLRVLQEKQFERVGGTAPIEVDVRVICATNRNLEEMVQTGQFREDLYYRLKGIVIGLPTLGERSDDIPLLVTHFLKRIAKEFGRTVLTIDEQAMKSLSAYPWPGNIRELENVLRSATLFAEDDCITLADLEQQREFKEGSKKSLRNPARDSEEAVIEQVLNEEFSLAEMKRRLELECIRKALEVTGGNITKAAKLLQMKRPRLSQIVNANRIYMETGGEGNDNGTQE